MHKLKLAYFGSPAFSAHLLNALLQDPSVPVEVSLVVTQPDKPVGKKHIITPSPVKLIAKKHNIPCWDLPLRTGVIFFPTWDVLAEGQRGPTGEKKNDTGAGLKEYLSQVDLALVFAYGFKELIPLDLLEAPKLKFDIGEGKSSGFINVHPSLLPRYRGSSPIAYPMLLGDELTGVTLFVMDEKMDHGPLVTQETVNIINDVRPVMERMLTETGITMVKKLLTGLASDNKLQLAPQDHTKSTRAPYMVKDDGFISLEVLKKVLKNEPVTLQELPQIVRNYLTKYSQPVKDGSGTLIHNFWKGMYPWPGVWTNITIHGQDKRLKLNEMRLENGALSLIKVQLEGKNEVDFPTFQKAYGLF